MDTSQARQIIKKHYQNSSEVANSYGAYNLILREALIDGRKKAGNEAGPLDCAQY